MGSVNNTESDEVTMESMSNDIQSVKDNLNHLFLLVMGAIILLMQESH